MMPQAVGITVRNVPVVRKAAAKVNLSSHAQ